MDPSLIIDNIRTANLTAKFQNELDYLNNTNSLNIFTNGQETDLELRKQQLESIINNNQDKITINTTSAKDELFKEIDKYTYKKQWNKLLAFHKIVKIKEYVKETVKDNELQEEIILKLSDYASQGRINTKKYVVYDPNLEKILSFPCLVVDNEKKTYQINIV